MPVTFDIFTDGASRNNNKVNEITTSSSACVICYKRVAHFFKTSYNIDATINVGELNAILIGIRYIEEIVSSMKSVAGIEGRILVNIHSDSSFCIRGLNDWAKTWIRTARAGTWYNSSGNPVANQHLFKEILSTVNELKHRYDVRFVYVPGHVGESKSKSKERCIRTFQEINGLSVDMETFSYYNRMNKLVDKLATETVELKHGIHGYCQDEGGDIKIIRSKVP